MNAPRRAFTGFAAAAGVLLLGGCQAGSDASALAAEEDPHAELACVECHDGGLADRELAAVPAGTCTGSGCHERDVPGEARIGPVGFAHRDHGSTEAVALGCAGCHSHVEGGEPLTAGAETCGLCHQEELSGEKAEDCRLCHETPSHIGVTSQGVAVPHEGLPWIEGGCVRCHYEVARPLQEVPMARCAGCHQEVEELAAASVGENLHDSHTEVTCTSCHDGDNHRIESMSSTVSLQCATCHTEEHDLDVATTGFTPASCNQCHLESHQGLQRLILGVVTNDAQPSPHFSAGLTCASCHTDVSGVPDATPQADGDACVDCHRAEYRTVLGWWEEGVAARTTLVERYLASAGRTLGTEAPGVVEARRLLDDVRAGAGEHNLPLTHRLLQASLDRAAEAYRETGRTAPARPSLGRAPRPGLCSYCHYEVDGPGMTEEMDDAFHRAVMGSGG